MDPLQSFVQAMSLAHVLDARQLEEVRQLAAGSSGDQRVLAAELLKRRWLTPFQINRLNAGRGHELLLGSYVLIERIGEGGMGQVFKARNWKLGQIVALKLIRKDLLTNEMIVARFRREIEATAGLNHPNIIRALDADHTDEGLFIVMDYVEGIDLGKRIKEQGPLPVAQVCDYMRQVALGLQHAHERGLIHRDIKPNNLLIDSHNNSIRILDLGLARLQETADGSLKMAQQPAITQLGIIIGTVDFIAPEQARDSRKVDSRADLYALGCTAYYLLTGVVPFAGGTPTERLLKHTLDPVPPMPEFAPAVRAIVHRLMAKKPADRYQTAGEVAQALEELLAHPERLELARSSNLPPTIPQFNIPVAVRIRTELVPDGPAPLAAIPQRAARPNAAPRRAVPGPTVPVIELAAEPARPIAAPLFPVASVMEEQQTQAAPPATSSHSRRKLICIGVGVAVLAAVISFPLLSPAPATQGDTKKEKPVPPKEEPTVWDGVVREFLVIGPLNRDSWLPWRIERDADPNATYEQDNQEVTWMTQKTDNQGALKVSSGFVTKPAILYAQVHIYSPTGGKVKLHCSSADLMRIRINGDPVYTWTAVRPTPKPDDDQVDVTLKEGWNQVLVRLNARGRRDFEFYLSFKNASRMKTALRPEK